MMKSILFGLLAALGFVALVRASDPDSKSASGGCGKVDWRDPIAQIFIERAGDYVCHVVRDQPCETWELEAVEFCDVTVRLTYFRLGKSPGVVSLDRKTMDVLSIEQ